MKKKIGVFLAIVLVLLGAIIAYFLTIPYVLVSIPNIPKDFRDRLPNPRSSFSYFVATKEGDKEPFLSKIRKPSLIIYTPLEEVEEYDGIPTLQWGVEESKASYSFAFNKEEMYSSFVSSFSDEPIAILYEESDRESEEICFTLLSKYDNLVKVSYSNRISIVNQEEIIKELDRVWGVIVLTPESSGEGWRNTKSRVVMDSRYASSSLTLDRVISIIPDWKEIIESALRGDEISPNYTFTVLKK